MSVSFRGFSDDQFGGKECVSRWSTGDQVGQVPHRAGPHFLVRLPDGGQGRQETVRSVNIINAITPNGNAADADGFGLDDIARIVMQNFLK